MENKFTKGEWNLPHLATKKNEHDCDCGYILNEQYEGAIATVHFTSKSRNFGHDNPPLEEAIANAKLICAAPELLEACERALQVLESENIFGQARLLLAVAIKKATQ